MRSGITPSVAVVTSDRLVDWTGKLGFVELLTKSLNPGTWARSTDTNSWVRVELTFWVTTRICLLGRLLTTSSELRALMRSSSHIEMLPIVL